MPETKLQPASTDTGNDRASSSSAPLNLEQKKNVRRQKIIDATEALVRETGSTDFSMKALADKAGFSTPTTYNLIGSKSTVLYVLLNQYQDMLDTSPRNSKKRSKDPFDRVIDAAEVAVEIYTADSKFIRALMRFLLGIPDPVHRPKFMIRGYHYWHRAFQGLQEAGYLDSSLTVDDFARDFLVYFSGVIDLWVHEELDDDQFFVQSQIGVIMRLLTLAEDKSRDRLLAKLKQYNARLAPLYPGHDLPV